LLYVPVLLNYPHIAYSGNFGVAKTFKADKIFTKPEAACYWGTQGTTQIQLRRVSIHPKTDFNLPPLHEILSVGADIFF